jgi:hypothetical protein
MIVRWKKELILAAVLIGFGLLVLPYMIYFVGLQIVGTYEGEGGALGLMLAIWAALGRGAWAAWMLVLSPYLVVQLLRVTIKIARWRPRVTPVTD